MITIPTRARIAAKLSWVMLKYVPHLARAASRGVL